MSTIARAIRIEKYAGEILDQTVDFSGQLIDSESVADGEIKAFDSQGADVTGLLVPGGASAADNKVSYRLAAAGEPGREYHVYVYAVLNTGEKPGQLIVMSIPKP